MYDDRSIFETLVDNVHYSRHIKYDRNCESNRILYPCREPIVGYTEQRTSKWIRPTERIRHCFRL